MRLFRLGAGQSDFVRGFLAAALLLSASPAATAAEFPFDQELVLDAAPIRPGKHMPMLSVASNGDATIELWCKTVGAHVELSDADIKVEAAPLPDAPPAMMGRDQCTPARVAADGDLLAAITQVTAWHRQGSGLVLSGPMTLRFRANDH